MKTLLKLANSRTTIPVLNTILVQNGTGYATDMDMLISCPVDQPDGLYQGNALKVGQFVRVVDHTPSDFPMLSGTEYGPGVTFSADDLAWVARAMSNEEVRYYLCGIYIEGETLAATDGQRLHVFGKPVKDKGAIIPRMAIEYALLAAKECKAESVTVRLGANRAYIAVGSYQIVTKLIDGNFPDYLRVIPTHENKADFYGQELVKPCKEALKLARAAKHKPLVRLNDSGALSASYDDIKGSWPMSTRLGIEIGLDANYLADIGLDGSLHYSDNVREPIKVISGNKTAVLMPIRL